MLRWLTLLLGCALPVMVAGQEVVCTPLDNNGDNIIGITDLVDLLARFGDSDLDEDGIWDSVDACVTDECGVCNGTGPEVLAIDTIIITYDSIYVEETDDWLIYELEVDTLLHLVCENQGCTDPVAENYDPYAQEGGFCMYAGCFGPEFDGHTYEAIEIGDQCWFAENLWTTIYANGDPIPGGLDDETWTTTTSGASAVYGEGITECQSFSPDIDACDDLQALETYGRLYNWHAVGDSRGLCPTGWHVPTHDDWTALVDYVLSHGFDVFQETTFTPACADTNAIACTFTFNMQDGFGDGWNGWTYDFLQNGEVIATETLADGNSGVALITLNTGVPCTVAVNTPGQFPNEVSWNLTDEAGNIVVGIGTQESTEGTALKSTSGWNGEGNGTDDFGFTALPAGTRWGGDHFLDAGTHGWWWSSTDVNENAIVWCLSGGNHPSSGSWPQSWGFATRCLRDYE